LLAEGTRHALGDHPRREIPAAAGAGDDDPDRLCRIRLS